MSRSHNSILRVLSFLQLSNEGSEEEDRQSFHFIHLTFQEYSAACYFARYWLKSSELPCIELKKNKSARRASILSHTLLNEQKYNVCYNMLWRYAAGLLHKRNNGNQQRLSKLFEQLEGEPKGLLGPAHCRLMTQWLGELPLTDASSSKFGDCQARIEKNMSSWLSFECEMNLKNSGLAGELHYPKHLVYAALQHASPDMKISILSCMGRKSRRSREFVRLARLWVTERQINGQGL